jgi:hypothetical protein
VVLVLFDGHLAGHPEEGVGLLALLRVEADVGVAACFEVGLDGF